MAGDDGLTRYADEDAERWLAVHERISALGIIVAAVIWAAVKHPEMLVQLRADLDQLEAQARLHNAHPAFLAELRGMASALKPTASAPDPSSDAIEN